MLVVPTPRFVKKLKRVPSKIYLAFSERILMFRDDPRHPSLNNHALGGKRKHQRSINITGDWRLIFEQYDKNTVRLIDIDTHANLYGA